MLVAITMATHSVVYANQQSTAIDALRAVSALSAHFRYQRQALAGTRHAAACVP